VTEPPSSQRWQVAVSAAGLAVAGWAAAVLAVTGAFLTPYRIGSVLVPVSLVLVAVGNTALVRFAFAVTGRLMLALVPGLVWLVVSFLGAERTDEGDLVLTADNWVAALYIVVGCLAIAVSAYRLFAAAGSSLAEPK
jgi:hypothetical protein